MIKFILKTLALLTFTLIINNCQCQTKDSLQEFKYTNGQTQFSYTYRFGVLNGPYKSFYETGVLWGKGNYINGQLNGQFITYTPEGKLAMEEEYQDGKLTYQKVYWEEVPYTAKEFLFSSDKGFVTVKDGKYVTLDSKTPDNIIEQKFNFETSAMDLYIWKGGKKKLYKSVALSK